jgi:hypothetical protein
MKNLKFMINHAETCIDIDIIFWTSYNYEWAKKPKNRENKKKITKKTEQWKKTD